MLKKICLGFVFVVFVSFCGCGILDSVSNETIDNITEKGKEILKDEDTINGIVDGAKDIANNVMSDEGNKEAVNNIVGSVGNVFYDGEVTTDELFGLISGEGSILDDVSSIVGSLDSEENKEALEGMKDDLSNVLDKTGEIKDEIVEELETNEELQQEIKEGIEDTSSIIEGIGDLINSFN